MNKQLIYLPLLLASLTSACSTNGISEPVAEAEVASKLAKKMHHTTPEGVISVDIVSDNKRLHLLTVKHQHGNNTFWYQQSDDQGESWSAPVKILNADHLPAKITRGNDAQITAQGSTIVVTWTQYVDQGRFHAGPMLAARSVDAGQTWQYAAAPPDWNGPHGYIDMAADQQAMYAVWLDSRSVNPAIKASQSVHYSRSIDGGLSWEANLTLDAVSCSCCWNTVKADGEGNTYVLYRDKQPSDLSVGVVNADQQWQYLNHVGAFNWQFDGCPHIGGNLDFQKIADKKRLHAVVGTGHPEHLGVHYLYSDDVGKNWSNSVQLGAESAMHADIAAHDDGRVFAVWDQMSASGMSIFIADSADQGMTWSAPRQVSKAGMRASHPRIIKTENGFLSLWTESDGQQQTLTALRL
ncbi:MAG: exo-alpha-sialidase [Methyloprofundus sp.]|nr:exo-alpha-sialidase [Methyloprofundus sp.]MBW6452686.1 glycoside hydrolase [Methyloprofundus sp.]